MKLSSILKSLILLLLCHLNILAAPPSDDAMMDRPDDHIHSDMPPPPPGNGMHGKPAGVLPDPFMFRDPFKLKTLLVEIGINDRTIQQIITLVRDFNREMEERMLKIQQEELNLKNELFKDNPDLGTIQKIISRKAQIFSEVEFSQIKRDISIKKLLTEEEFEKWKSKMREQMRQMHQQKIEGRSGTRPDVQDQKSR
ncbi:MAG TPA: hypothetical protein VHO70_06695 [Chitinispirillaceae bacterium]|nr:hypothetical protein [Chitinispirillaceae bacterium]